MTLTDTLKASLAGPRCCFRRCTVEAHPSPRLRSESQVSKLQRHGEGVRSMQLLPPVRPPRHNRPLPARRHREQALSTIAVEFDGPFAAINEISIACSEVRVK